MRIHKRILAYAMYILLGGALLVLGITEVVDAFWSGMGGGLIGVGTVRLIQSIRYCKDETYREKKEVEIKDERSLFLRNKAWAWAGYLFVLAAAVCTIICRLLGQDILSMAASFAVCFIMLAYWISYLVLNRKY